ncbi:MAG: DUF4423 domain-containing protein [Pseudobdellovibrionaceae bacterium]
MNLFMHTKSHLLLNELIKSQPKKGWGAGRRLAQHLNVNTSFVSLILTGRQLFSLEQGCKVSEFFGWSDLEKKYFLLMLSCERAGTAELKQFYKSEMELIRQESLNLSKRLEKHTELSEEHKARYYSSAIYVLLRLYCSLGPDGKSISDIQTQFQMSLQNLRPMISFLIETGLIVEINGHLHLGSQHIHLPRNSPHLLKHHTNWRLKALQKAENLPENELIFTAPVSLSKDDFDKIREELSVFIKKTIDTIKQSPGETVACLNIDWFKIC